MRETSESPSRIKWVHRRAGMALVMVLAIVALLMGLVLALLSMGSSEARSSAAISQVAQARQLTDMPVSIVMAQIRGATSNLGISKTWSSQPGMIRVFGTEAGAVAGRSKLHSAWRLYSSDKMSEDGATFSAAGEVASLATWQGDPAHFTDINEPVTRLDPGGNIHRVFPVLDARALKAAAAESEKLEGFGVSVGGAPAATADHPFPMPVRWLYVLQDGRVVAPSGGTGGSATFNSAEVTSSNPVVGRIAFWTDDESCKININTASEGTGWNMPRSTSWSDRNFAYFPPAQNEFQRFPGHPAMVSLSPVLQAFDPKYAYQFPEVQIDGTVSNKTSYQDWLRGIYSLLPRVQLGDAGQGSMGGTIVPSDAGIPLKRERLFASLDEMFYGSAFAGGQRRPNAAGGALDATDLEMGRFFMTAHSRAPEVNLYNRPRVSLWPLQVDKSKRTAKDKLIAYCSTYGKQLGGFQRVSTWQSNAAQGSSQGPTQDFQLEENQKIFGYLQKLTRAPVPGFGIETFDTKYGSLNRNQILLQMFDLVRWGVNGNNAFEPPVYHYLPPGVYTGAGSSATAEASAVPVVAEGTAAEGFGKKLKAFGRYPSIVEASIIFMATDVELKTDGSPVDVVAPLNQADKTNRMRAFLVLQPFTPVVGTPPFTPNVRFRIKGLEQWKVNGQNLGFPADAVNRVWTTSSVTGDRGQTTAYTFLNNQFYKDGAAKTMVPGGTGADESTSFPFVSLEMDVSTADSFTFTGGPITIEMHLGAGAPGALDESTLVQSAAMDFPNSTGAWPVPKVRLGTNSMPSNNTWGNAKAYMDLQRRFTTGGGPFEYLIVFGDTVRSVAVDPKGDTGGDFRLLCALRDIPATCYAPHFDYQNPAKEEAHGLRHGGSTWAGHYGRSNGVGYLNNSQTGRQSIWQIAGYEFTPGGQVTKSYGLLRDVSYWQDCQPAGPRRLDGAYNAGGNPGDWDTGVGRIEDGPYINKPDDNGITKNTAAAGAGYFARLGIPGETTGRTFSPNRQICSAVAFGSLPTGVHPNPTSGTSSAPWQTLLFCPNPASRSTPADAEPNAQDHWGFQPPFDHLLLDHFWVPVVEPYAISEPFSTAGKINLNSQIMPFSYIQRDTGIHAALRSVRVTALPHSVAWAANATTRSVTPDNKTECYKSTDYWLKYETVYGVNAQETVKGLHRRFNQGDVFRSASEICSIFLVPSPLPRRRYFSGVPNSSPSYESMIRWWNGDLGSQKDGLELTGENVRESPYNQLYPLLTTKSNVFTVHYRVQVLKKSRSSAAVVWDEARDAISAEQRGSVVLERYLDPNEDSLPDFFDTPSQDGSLDDLYRFRVISKTTFAP